MRTTHGYLEEGDLFCGDIHGMSCVDPIVSSADSSTASGTNSLMQFFIGYSAVNLKDDGTRHASDTLSFWTFLSKFCWTIMPLSLKSTPKHHGYLTDRAAVPSITSIIFKFRSLCSKVIGRIVSKNPCSRIVVTVGPHIHMLAGVVS